MKNNKLKAKKGMTLIEVIISVTLLSILIVPLSTMVTSSLKNKEQAADKQKATYIGQKILEELKSYDYITLTDDGTNKYFNLLDASALDKEITEVEVPGTNLKKFKGEFERNIFGNKNENTSEKLFDVEVNITKNEDFNNDFKFVNNDNIGYELTLKDNSIYFNGTNFIFRNDIVNMKISNDKLTIDNGNVNGKVEISRISGKGNIIMIGLENTFNQSTNLEIENLQKKDSGGTIVNEPLEIILIKNSGANKSVNIISAAGDILIKEINADDILDFKDTYNYEVIVKDKNNKELFKGKSSSKLIIK